MPVASREIHEGVVVGVLSKIWIVFVGKTTVEHFESDVLTKFEFLQEWNAVEYLSVQVPIEVECNVFVVKELHIAQHHE